MRSRPTRYLLLLLAIGLVGPQLAHAQAPRSASPSYSDGGPDGDDPAWTRAAAAAAALATPPPRIGHSPSLSRGIRAVQGDFPPLPPDPYAQPQEMLPPLEKELWHHGGSYLYSPEGDRLNWPGEQAVVPYQLQRLPETWQEPRPLTLFTDFLGADPIRSWPRLHWPGPEGYAWEPQFVGYGGYQLFGLALEQNRRRQDLLGHQLLLDFDLRLTGTERFHLQLRPLGRDNTGGSYYQFSDPSGYVDNSTATPTRYWVEAELHSLLGGYVDPFVPLDYHVVVGKFPFALHNALLMNDEVLGVVANKNTIYLGGLSHLNVQLFYAFQDVDTFANADASLYGVHATADYHKVFYEFTYAVSQHEFDASRDSYFAGVSRTQFYGPLSLAARGLFKWGDSGGRGSGQLLVLESNFTRYFDHQPWGVEKGVFFCNAFVATAGWNSIGGANFNRLRTAFEVNPLVRLAAGPAPRDTAGLAWGVQLFRHHEDESFVPEIALETPDGEPVWGMGMRYQRKTGPRTFIEALGIINVSEDSRFDREGIFAAHTLLF